MTHTPNSRHSLSAPSLRSAARLGIGLLSLLSLSAGTVAHAGTVNWDTSPGDWFANPSHWSNGSRPGTGDDAVNQSTAAITLGQDATVSSFFSNGAFSLTGGTFSGSQASAAGTITINNLFTMNGGGVSNFTLNQGSGGSVVLTTSGGNFFNSSIVNADLDLFTHSDAYARIINTNTLSGTTTLATAYGLYLADGNANLINNGTIAGYGNIYQQNGGATLTNSGTLNANMSGQAININADNFKNTGTVKAVNGGTFSIAGNTTTTDSGTFSASGAGSVVSLLGTLTGSGSNLFTASNGGQIQVNGATLLGTINTDAATALVYSTSGGNHFNGTTINGNLDLFTHSDAYVQLINTDTLNGNTTLGTAYGLALADGNANLINNGTIAGFGNIYQQNGNATLTNNGTINANTSAQAISINADNFKNAGTTEATNGGTLTIAGNTTTTNTGLLTANTGGVLNLSGTFNDSAAGSFNGLGGTINVNGATLLGTVNGVGATSLVYTTSNGNHFNNTTVNANLDLFTHSDAYVQLLNTDTLNGTTTLGTAYGLAVADGNANLINNGTISGFGRIYQQNGNATLTNNGIINANTSGQAISINTDNFTNAGTTEATNGGTLNVAGNTTTTDSGDIKAVGAGSVFSLSGTLTGTTGNLFTASSGGQIQVNGATLLGTINGASGTSLIYNTSNGNHFNNTTVNTNLDLFTHSDAYVQIINTDTLNGNTMLGTAYGLAVADGNANLVNNGTISGFGGIYQQNGNATLTNNGTINANTSGQAISINEDNFKNAGTVKAVNGATLTIAGNTTTTDSGTFSASGAGSVVSLSGTVIGNTGNLFTAADGGQIQVNGATLLGTINGASGTSLIYNTSNGNHFNNTTVNADLDLFTHSDAYVQIQNTDTLNGTTTLGTAYGLAVADGNANLVNNGTISGFGNIYQQNGGATLTNNGTISAGGGTLAINTDNFKNAGTLQVQSGATLNVAGNTTTTDSGNLLVKTGGTATFANPNLVQTGGATQVDGTLNSSLSLAGGTLSGTGTVNGNAQNNGGTVAAGNAASPFGTLAVNGTFSQGANGVFDVAFDNALNNLLQVSGAVTTGGVLDVSYLGTDASTRTAPFTFLSYGSLTSSLAGTGTGPTQYFANETFLADGTGVIAGQNGFTYALINNAGADGLQLQVLTPGTPSGGAPVPEASTTVSLGLLLMLGGLTVAATRRRLAVR